MYTIQASLNTDSPIMLIDKHVGFDSHDGMGIDGAQFQRELLELDGMGFKCIAVWINSPGGVVMDGYSIYNAILHTKTPVDTYCYGMAASIAGVIFQAGRKRTMTDYSRLMFHNPSGGDDKKALNAIQGSIVTMVSKRSGKTEAEIASMMDKTSWIIPEDALNAGLCDSIQNSSDSNVPRGTAKNFWKESNQYINSLLKTNNITIMPEGNQASGSVHGLSLIANYLGLNTEATEGSVLTELKNRVNAEILNRSKAEDAVAAMKKQISDKQKELDELKEKLNAATEEAKNAKNEATNLKKEKQDAEEATKKEAAKNKATVMVSNYAKLGRISNKAEDTQVWIDKATEDFDGTEAMIKTLPVNGKAAVIQTATDQIDPNVVPASALARMAQIQNNLRK